MRSKADHRDGDRPEAASRDSTESDQSYVDRFTAIVRQNQAMLARYAVSLAWDEDESKDLIQGTWEKAWMKFHSMPGDTNYSAWMVRILRNQFIDLCRRKHSRPPTTTLITSLESATEVPEDEPVWANITTNDIRSAVKLLPAHYREPFELRETGLSYHEIASILGIPKNTVGTRLRKARKRLKELLLSGVRSGREDSNEDLHTNS